MAIRLDGLEAGERVENWSGFYARLHKLTATILQVIDATVSKVKPLHMPNGGGHRSLPSTKHR